jgi:hypothetical protein
MNLNHAEPLGLAILGLLLGIRHSTDPDHVIAVTAILTCERRLKTAARIGMVWGLGHTLTVLAVGAAIIFLKIHIPVRIGLGMEFAVALALILLGIPSALGLCRRIAVRIGWSTMDGEPVSLPPPVVHSHSHTHDGFAHSHSRVHAHSHRVGDVDANLSSHREHVPEAGLILPRLGARRPLVKSFAVGLVHGLAGSAAIALLVLSAIPQPLWAAAYLVVFCVGVIVGMTLITTAIGAPFIYASNRIANINRSLAFASGLLSFGFGLFLAFQIGIVDGLFGAVPVSIPH